MENLNEYAFIYEQTYYFTANSKKPQFTITYLNMEDFNNLLEPFEMNGENVNDDRRWLDDGRMKIEVRRVLKSSGDYSMAKNNTKAKNSGNPQDFVAYQIQKVKDKSLQYLK